MQLWARRRAIWLSLAAALALAACDESAATAEHLQKAQELSLAGDLPAAIIELKNALQADANNAGARAMLGELYLQTGDPASALKELLRARELGVADDTVKLLVNRARLQTREFQAIVDDVPADQPMQDDVGAELAALRGLALLELGRFAEAQEALEKVVATRATAMAYAGLARIALFKQDTAGAEQHISEGLAKYPNDGVLTLLKGEQQMQSREFEAAQTTFEALAKAEPNNLMAAIGLVRAELALGRVEPARVVIDDVLEKQPGNLGVILLRSIASLKSGDYTAAQQDANSVLAVDDRNTVALYVAGAASYALEQYEQALRSLTTYVAAVPADAAGRKLLAAAQLRMGDAEAAQKTVGSSVDVEDPGYLALMSSASTLKGDLAGGMRYLEQAVVQSPENARLRTQLGLMRIAAGDPAQGEMDLDQALGLDPGLADDPRYDRAEIALIEGYLRKGEFDKALTAIEEWQAKHPDDATGYVMAGVAHARKGDTAAARAAFGKALEIKPGAPDASANLAILELQANNPKGAELVLQQAIAHHPDHLRTLLLLSQLSARTGDWSKARDWLEKAVTSHPDHLPTRLVLSRIYFNLGQAESALQTIARVVREMPDNVAALEVKARAEMETGRLTDAIETYEAIVARYPQAAQTNYELSQAYMAVGNLDKARTAAETAVAAEPNHAGAKLQLARVLLRQRDAAAAEGVVADLASAYPNAADVLEVQGDLALLQDEPGRAVLFYRDARKVSDNVRLAAAEARALAADGDGLAATAVLEEWVARHPQDTAARLELGRYLQAGGRMADAETNLREILAYDPGNWVAHNSLAQLFLQSGDVAAAHPAAARAYELAPDNPLTMDTLGVILLEQGKAEEATSLIRRASELAPNNPNIGFHLARAYAQLDRKVEARQLLTTLLDKFSAFSERERAVALLAELGS